MNNQGVLYIAFGDLYIKEAIVSAESVKQYNPNLHITLMCDNNIDSKYIDNVVLINATHIRAKVDYIDQTPYEQTIFLDSDTIIDHSLDDLFQLLDKYDFCIAHDYARKRQNIADIIPEYANIPYAFSEVNPGVIAFKNNDNVKGFFNKWRDLFYKYHDVMIYEQPTFRVALWEAEMKLYILPPEFNARSKDCRNKSKKLKERFGNRHLEPRIYHLHANKNISQGIFKYEDYKKCLKICKKNVYPI
ncbi:putative nucleotide-diphospho-sugar transferase [Vibrio tritonius]|uniref:putative nucleotide-diphospho-sugar transferase n=1 Tax=Vibrio tritonius TaxID=1435069 RepID=UPI00315CF7D9